MTAPAVVQVVFIAGVDLAAQALNVRRVPRTTASGIMVLCCSTVSGSFRFRFSQSSTHSRSPSAHWLQLRRGRQGPGLRLQVLRNPPVVPTCPPQGLHIAEQQLLRLFVVPVRERPFPLFFRRAISCWMGLRTRL